MPIEDFFIRVYGEVCSAYEIALKTRLHRPGFSPALSDPEVLKLEFVGAFRGLQQRQSDLEILRPTLAHGFLRWANAQCLSGMR
jgi:hypothetical protein